MAWCAARFDGRNFAGFVWSRRSNQFFGRGFFATFLRRGHDLLCHKCQHRRQIFAGNAPDCHRFGVRFFSRRAVPRRVLLVGRVPHHPNPSRPKNGRFEPRIFGRHRHCRRVDLVLLLGATDERDICNFRDLLVTNRCDFYGNLGWRKSYGHPFYLHGDDFGWLVFDPAKKLNVKAAIGKKQFLRNFNLYF